MKNRYLAASILPLLLIVAACNQAPSAADPSLITERSDAWEAALNAPDLDALVELYASDARLMPPNGPMAMGVEAVRDSFGAMIDAGLGGTLTTVEARVAGDMGHNIGVYELSAGGEVVDTGKFVEIWARGADGTWRIVADIWNSDTPVATMDHPHVMITHEVEDAERWLGAWRGDHSRHALFEANGAAHVHTFVGADNPNLTGLVVAVDDMEALEALLGSEDTMAAATEDGVDLDTVTVLYETD